MERTEDFLTIVRSSNAILPKYLVFPSLFLVKAASITRQIESFAELLKKLFVPYVGYHRYLPAECVQKDMVGLNENEIKAMDCEILSFISSIAIEMQGLRNHVDNTESNGSTSQSQFYKLIIQNIMEKLNNFTKLTDQMQREKHLRNTSPFRLLADDFYRIPVPIVESDPSLASEENRGPEKTPLIRVPVKPKGPLATTSALSSSSATSSSPSLSQRYVDEVASLSAMRAYEAIAAQQRRALLKESRLLRIRFGNEYQEAQRMERTVSGISAMIGEFAALIAGQSELVDGIESAGKEATSKVRQTEGELQLTLERSQSHQWGMAGLVLLLALGLLAADWLTP